MEDRRSLPPYEDELSLALLRSADHDEPSAAAYSKAAAALGVSAAVGLGASLPTQVALVSNGLSAGGAVRWSGSVFAKFVVVGLASVLLVAGGAALLAHRSHARSAAALPPHVAALGSPSAINQASSVSESALANAVPAPTPIPVDLDLDLDKPAPLPVPVLVASKGALARTAEAASNVQPASASNAARPPKVSSLPEQVLSLDRARVALNSGDAAGALAEIAHYRATWPRGVFLEEASVLEIESLAKRGEIVLAGMRAQAYVTAHPDSPQASRLRALIPGQSR